MNNRFFFAVIFAITVFVSYAANTDLVHTTLVLIEETENGKKIVREPAFNQPFADGLYETLWNYDGIFFDGVPSQKIPIETNGTLCPYPFIREATACGADSLLLIKVNYSTSVRYSKVTIVLDDLRYHLYSIYDDKTVSVGDLSGQFQNTTERPKQQTYLKALGEKVLKIIYEN